jgi:hypothetical protein
VKHEWRKAVVEALERAVKAASAVTVEQEKAVKAVKAVRVNNQ